MQYDLRPVRSCLPLYALMACLVPSAALAQRGPRVTAWSLRLRDVAPGAVTVDGSLGEWRGIPGTSLGTRGRIVAGGGWSGPEDASANFALLDDRANLIVGVHVRDQRFVRTARYGAGEDQLVLTLAFPGGGAPVELRLLPGGPGVAAKVRRSGQDVAGAAAVEMARDGGWSAEFAIPWRSLPEARAGRTGLRAALSLVDCDSEARLEVETVLATARVGRSSSTVPAVRIAAEEGMLNSFRRDRDLVGVTPSFERTADVAGDRAPERIAVVEQYVMAFGPGIRGGQSYVYRSLPVRAARDVLGLEARDVSGDGKAEIVLRWRETNAAGERELWGAFGITSGDVPTVAPLLVVETGKRVGDRRLANEVRVVGGGEIEQRPGAVTGFDEASYVEAPARDAQPILLPWGPIASRRFRWDGASFVVGAEEPRAPTRRPNGGARPPAGGTATAPPPPPRAPSNEELLDAFRAQVGLAGARARFDESGDVGEDRRPERVAVIDRYIVIVGPGFLGGTRWLYQELGVVSAADVLSLQLDDVTGDGKKDVVLRTRQLGAEVTREIQSIHALVEGRLVRLWSQEVLRTGAAGQRVECTVRIVRHGRRPADLEVRPGRATGWTEATWRFGRDPTPPEPLLLPWSGVARRVYRFTDGTFRAAE